MDQILRKNWLSFLILLLGISLDQVSKQLALKNLIEKDFQIFSNFFSLSLHFNEGIAFSIPIKSIFFPLIVILLLTIFIIKFNNHWFDLNYLPTRYSFLFIYMGAISNIIDRFIHNKVIDFISILKFPVFNLADVFITVGVLIIILYQKNIFDNLG